MTGPARKDKVRVVLVGAGYVATHHLAALRSLDCAEVVAVCDLDLSAAQALANRYGVPHALRSLDDVAPLQPDAVYVLTPPASHAAIARQALEMGCHTLVEKPLADTAADCKTLVELAKVRGLSLGVNHSDLLDPVVMRAVDAVNNGRIGEVRSVDIVRNSDYPPHAGGALPAMLLQGSYPLRDLGVHGLYTIEALLGPIDAVQVRWQVRGPATGIPFSEWQVDAQAGPSSGRLRLSWTARPMENTLVVRGTRGSIHVDRFLQVCRVQRLLPGPKFVGIVLGGLWQALADTVRIPWSLLRFALRELEPSPGIRMGARAFAESVHAGAPPPFSGEDALRIARWMDVICATPDAEATAQRAQRLSPLPPADVLVTGGTGFLGRALVAALRARGERVRVLARGPQDNNDPDCTYAVGDLGDQEVVDHVTRGVRAVYHLGAGMRGAPADFERGTIWGTRNVVEACLRHSVDKLVHVSSLGLLDHAGRRDGEVVDEAYRLDPRPNSRGHYTRAKQEAEAIVRNAIAERGLRAIIIRPGQIFGPGAQLVPPNGVVSIAGRWRAGGEARQTRPRVDRDDVVDALLSAADADAALGAVIHVVDDVQLAQGDYLRACADLPSPPRVVRVPRWAMRAMAAILESLGRLVGRDMPLTLYKVDSLRPLAALDGRRARELLSWAPRIGVAKGLELTFNGGRHPALH